MSESKVEELFASIMALVVCTPVSLVLNGYVLSKYWEWFVVPLGVDPIGWFHAYGLATLVVYFGHIDTRKKDLAENIAGIVAGSVVRPVFAGLLGLLLHSLMGGA